MRPAQLNDEEVQQHLEHLPEWSLTGNSITRQYSFASFTRALEFVNAVGEAAEDVNHHPDIDIRYQKVTLILSTHDISGLTRLDMEMAGAADSAAESIGGAA